LANLYLGSYQVELGNQSSILHLSNVLIHKARRDSAEVTRSRKRH